MKSKQILSLLPLVILQLLPGVAPADPPAPSQSPIAAIKQLLNKGVDAREKGDDKTAEKLWLEGLAQSRALKSPLLISDFLHNLGFLALYRGDFAKALNYDREALQLRQELHRPKEVANSLNAVGNDHLRMGRYTEALSYFQQALEIEDQGRYASDKADTLTNVGIVHLNTGQWLQAQTDFEQALQIYHESNDQANSYNQANAYDVQLNLSLLALQMGLLDQAQKYLQPCLAGISDAPKDTQALVLNAQGNLYFAQGLNGLALESYAKALNIARSADVQYPWSQALHNLANVYLKQGQLAEAEEYHLTANKLLHKIGNSVDVAVSNTNLAMVYMYQKRYQEALQKCEEAEKLLKTVFSPLNLANTYSDEGAIYQELGQFAKALDYFDKAQKLYTVQHDVSYLPSVLDNIGRIESELNHFDTAEVTLKRARDLREAQDTPRDLAQTILAQGILYLKEGKRDLALAAFAQAVEKYEAITQEATNGSQVVGFQQTDLSPYKVYAAALQSTSPSDALIMLERGRGRGLAKQMAQNLADLFLPSAEAARWKAANQEFNLAARMATATRNYSQKALTTEKQNADKRQVDAYSRKAIAGAKLTSITAELSQRYPNYRFWSGAKPVTFPQLQALAANNPDTLYLQWAVVDMHQTLLMALSQRDGLHAFLLPIGLKPLETLCTDYRSTLTAMGELLNKDTRQDRVALSQLKDQEPQKAKELSQTLLQPLETAGLLKEGRYKRLVLVPDGPLVDLPFAALMDAKGRRLGARYALSTSISFGMLTWSPSLRTSSASLLGIAPFAQSTPAGGYGVLPSSSAEMRAIRHTLPSATLLQGTQATKTNWLAQANRFAVLHFATHGLLDDRDGLHSSLLFAPETGEKAGDTRLEAREILSLPLSAQLAVLSACDSGRGQTSGGEGNLGLAWAFRVAGCSSVVASQWPVNDQVTAQFMDLFYRQLKAGKRKDEAVQQAMAMIRKDPQHDHPYFWAAFQVIGDTKPLKLSR